MVSPDCAARLRLSSRRADVLDDRRAQVGHQQVRDHAGEPRARARAPPSPPPRPPRPPPRRPAGRAARRARSTTRPGVGGDATPGRGPRPARPGSSGSSPATSATISSGTDAIGSTRPRAPSRRPTQSSPCDGVAEQLPQRDDQQVADARGRAGRPRSAKRCWTTLAPGLAPLVVAAQRRERHPQVTRRQHAELAAEPAARPAVVGDRHDGGQRVGHPPQRGQRRGQAVTATQRGDARAGRRPGPRDVPARSLAPQVAVHDERAEAGVGERGGQLASAIATLRCLPPVQPTAIVTYCLPSRTKPGASCADQARRTSERRPRRPSCPSTYARTSSSRPVFGRSASTQCGLGRNRQSTTRSASTGRPYL